MILKTLMLQGELTSASAILDFLASPETLDLPGQVSNQNLSLEGKSDILSTSPCKDITLACSN